MGLLDDAIRDHLDLKRRRGADPGEVERAEREALGPVRRGVDPAQEPGHETDDVAAYGVEPAVGQDYAPVDEPAWDDSPVPAPETSEPGPLTFESSATAAPPPAEPSPAAGVAPAASPEPAPEPEPAPAPADPEPAAPAPPPPSVPPPPAASAPPATAPPEQAMPAESAAPAEPAPPPPAPAPAPGPLRNLTGNSDPTGGETVEYDVERALEAEPPREDDDVLEETPEFLQDTPDHDRLWFEQRPPRDFDFDG